MQGTGYSHGEASITRASAAIGDEALLEAPGFCHFSLTGTLLTPSLGGSCMRPIAAAGQGFLERGRVPMQVHTLRTISMHTPPISPSLSLPLKFSLFLWLGSRFGP